MKMVLTRNAVNGLINDTELLILKLIKEREGVNREEISRVVKKGIRLSVAGPAACISCWFRL